MTKKATTLDSQVIEYILENNLFAPGSKLVVAVSGGADSVCLLHILVKWQSRLRLKLHIAHMDHRLRGTESAADAEYVADLADKLSIPATIEKEPE